MIDPCNITDFNRTQSELQEFLLFAIVVAGKNAKTQATALERFLARRRRDEAPFEYLVRLWRSSYGMNAAVREARLGQYRRIIGAFSDIARSIAYQQANSPFASLHTVQTVELERIHGVGPKTSRFFILHTQADASVACLDTHILKFLRAMNIKGVPDVTPQNMKTYGYLEGEYLRICRTLHVHPATFDLAVWNLYSSNGRRVA